MRFNDWLRDKKKEFNLSNQQIADACEVSASAVGRWMNGSRLPDRPQVAKLAMLFKVSPTTIMRMTDNGALQEEVVNTARQQSKAELLAYVPEIGEFGDLLMQMSVEDRAAFILLARSLVRGKSK